MFLAVYSSVLFGDPRFSDNQLGNLFGNKKEGRKRRGCILKDKAALAGEVDAQEVGVVPLGSKDGAPARRGSGPFWSHLPYRFISINMQACCPLAHFF